MIANRPAEYIRAEEALTTACQYAVENGIVLVYDIYGVILDQNSKVYYMNQKERIEGRPCMCAIGSFLWDRPAPPISSGGRVGDAANRLGVDRDWLFAFEHGFAGSEEKPDSPDEEWDGYETGLRLRNMFHPQQLHKSED